MVSKNRKIILIAATLFLSFIPTFMMLGKNLGAPFFFSSYTIASTVYAVLAIFLLLKVKINLPFPLLLLILIIKIVIAQTVLLYLFTPIFDFAATRISIEKMCSPATIEWVSKYGDGDSFSQGCNQLLQAIGIKL